MYNNMYIVISNSVKSFIRTNVLELYVITVGQYFYNYNSMHSFGKHKKSVPYHCLYKKMVISKYDSWKHYINIITCKLYIIRVSENGVYVHDMYLTYTYIYLPSGKTRFVE
jgi:hypothetical protein